MRVEVELELQTPLWTADASKEARRVVSTGLMGGLRWWYEALVRGLGGWACDPTDVNARCPPAGRTVTPANVHDVLCPACQLFGATGWAKTFTLAVRDGTDKPAYPPTGKGRVKTTGDRLNGAGEPSAWYFPPGRQGRLILTLRSRDPRDDQTLPMLLGLLDLIRRHAALGAKTGLGYGLFEWKQTPADLPLPADFARIVAQKAGQGRREQNRRWPDLREMFFAQVDLERKWKPGDFVNFKYDLRAAFRAGDADTSNLRHFLLGKVDKAGNQAAKVKMALLPDRSTLRLWGWIPQDLPGGFSRGMAMNILYNQITRVGTISHWREFDSARDTREQYADPPAFLQSLMEG